MVLGFVLNHASPSPPNQSHRDADPLHEAAINGDLEALQRILSEGTSTLNKQDEFVSILPVVHLKISMFVD